MDQQRKNDVKDGLLFWFLLAPAAGRWFSYHQPWLARINILLLALFVTAFFFVRKEPSISESNRALWKHGFLVIYFGLSVAYNYNWNAEIEVLLVLAFLYCLSRLILDFRQKLQLRGMQTASPRAIH